MRPNPALIRHGSGILAVSALSQQNGRRRRLFRAGEIAVTTRNASRAPSGQHVAMAAVLQTTTRAPARF
jgi:hypothetical protein